MSDDIGILGDRPDSVFGPGGIVIRHPALCQRSLGAQVLLFPWGDLGARCTNGNGNPDTEDLDGDNVLDAQGPNDDVFRYVIDLGDSASKYLVRSAYRHRPPGHTATWTLYRVPLRAPDDTIGTPDIRLVKQMRVTFIVPAHAGSRFDGALRDGADAADRRARGSRARRQPHSGDRRRHRAAPRSGRHRLGVDAEHRAGLHLAAGDRQRGRDRHRPARASWRSRSTRSRSASWCSDLLPGERAEGYTRLLTGSQNLLAYRAVAGLGARPGAGVGRRAVAGVRQDRQRRQQLLHVSRPGVDDDVGSGDGDRSADLVDRPARADRERTTAEQPTAGRATRACGGDSTAWVRRATGRTWCRCAIRQINPPNLAAVQEMAAGDLLSRLERGTPIAETELWVDDIRASAPISQLGVAGTASARLVAADVAQFDVDLRRRGRPVPADGPESRATRRPGALSSTGTVHIDRFLPDALRVWRFRSPSASSSGHVTARTCSAAPTCGPGLERSASSAHSRTTTWSFCDPAQHAGPSTALAAAAARSAFAHRRRHQRRHHRRTERRRQRRRGISTLGYR